MKHVFAPALMISLAYATTAVAQRDVPVWYVQYEVTMKANHTITENAAGGGTLTTTWSLDRSFSATTKLDMRNEGSVIATTQSATADPEKFKNMSQAEMMKYSQDMLEAMQYQANWMPGAPELGDGQDAMLNLMRARSVPLRFTYKVTRIGKGLVDEMGTKFDSESIRSGSVSDGMIDPGDQQKFELNTKTKKYWLLIPHSGQAVDAPKRSLKWETVDKTRSDGQSAWQEERKTDDAEADWLPNAFAFDGPGFGSAPLIEGTLAVTDNITGEQSFAAHFTDGPTTVPVTVKFRYTVSSTPPAPAKK